MSYYKKIRDQKQRTRLRRKRAIRGRVHGTAERPRLSVFRSLKHIYAQAIDDTSNKVLASVSDLDALVKTETAGKKKGERARQVGKTLAEKLKAQSVTKVVFDRNGFIYHGRVRQVADGAREGGLEF